MMLLLGSGLGAVAVTLEKALARRGLSRRPQAIPPGPMLAALGLMYASWIGLRWSRAALAPTLDDQTVFLYADLACALVHVDLALFILEVTRSPLVARFPAIWRLRQGPALSLLIAIAFASTTVVVWLTPTPPDWRLLKSLSIASGLLGAAVVCLNGIAKRPVQSTPTSN